MLIDLDPSVIVMLFIIHGRRGGLSVAIEHITQSGNYQK